MGIFQILEKLGDVRDQFRKEVEVRWGDYVV
jgi:hypothetical protein